MTQEDKFFGWAVVLTLFIIVYLIDWQYIHKIIRRSESPILEEGATNEPARGGGIKHNGL